MIRTTVAAGIAAGMALVTGGAAFGQSAGAPLHFEVASIKPVAPSLDGRYMVRMRVSEGGLNYSSASLKAIIERACDVRDFQISGPDWMASARFDVVAKLPAGAPRSGVPEMLRSLLAERFHMTVHRETRQVPMYALVVGKNGPRMKESAADGNAPPPESDPRPGPAAASALDCGPRDAVAKVAGWMINKGPGHVEGHAMNMASLTNLLSSLLGRPVVNETGLAGSYDFDLVYAPAAATADSDALPLLDAVQSDIGLKLVARKGPLELVVVDHVEEKPTEN